ncbi:MAG: transposase, partial [Candidatus Competibacteraceae bacterium]|nr:transposase [Candidatus Competibacteraceae bacterium]
TSAWKPRALIGKPWPENAGGCRFTVSGVNPARIKAYRVAQQVRTKTDAVDACLIADFCARQHPRLDPTAPGPARTAGLGRSPEAWVVMRTQEQNRLPVAHPSVRPGIESLIAHRNSVIAEAEAEAAIRQRIDDDPPLKAQQRRLDSVPGLGDKTIPVLWSFYGGPGRFDPARPAAAFCGPSTRASTNRAAACAANFASRKWVMRGCARRFTCRPW